MHNRPVIERISEFDFRGIPLNKLDSQLTAEGYKGSEILAAICVFNIQDSMTRQKRQVQARHFFDKNPAKAEAMAEYLLQQYGHEERYQLISQAAVQFMTNGKKHKPTKHHRSHFRFTIPLWTTLLAIVFSGMLIFYLELNALFIYIAPILYVLGFNLLRWIFNRKSVPKTKQKILYPI